jgi:hypothetical protein
VDVPGVRRVLEQRAVRSAGDRHVAAGRGLQHSQGVADDGIDRRVAADAGHGSQVERRVGCREEQGAGVVHTGVDVEDDGSRGRRHAVNVPPKVEQVRSTGA